MTIKTLSPWMLAFSLLAPLPACDDDDDGGDDSAGDSANDQSGGGDEDGGGEQGGDEATSSSSETCMTSHSCLNGVCQCETPGIEGAACTDDEECVDECEICG